jgi:hypothetical protein
MTFKKKRMGRKSKINIGKTKTMRMNTRIDTQVKIDGKEIEGANEFTYQGSKVNKESGASEDIKSSLQKARNAFIALHNVWKSMAYSISTKFKVKATLLYGAECWKITGSDLRKCKAFQNRCLRRILKSFGQTISVMKI